MDDERALTLRQVADHSQVSYSDSAVFAVRRADFHKEFMYTSNEKKDRHPAHSGFGGRGEEGILQHQNLTRDDLLAAHHVPPELLCIVPSNSGEIGTPGTAASVLARNRTKLLQARGAELTLRRCCRVRQL